MSVSPKRIDTNFAFALIDDEPSFSKEDYERIEKRGNIKLCENLRQELLKALDFYHTQRRIERESSTRGDQFKLFEKISEAAGTLDDIFSDEDDHATSRVLHKIEDEFEKVIEEHTFTLKVRWSLFSSRMQGKPEPLEENFFQLMADNLKIIHHAALSAKEKFESEGPIDKGGKNTDVLLNSLYQRIDEVFQKVRGKRQYKSVFFEEVIKGIPKSTRPVFDNKSWDTVKRQINRVKNKPFNKNKVNQPKGTNGT